MFLINTPATSAETHQVSERNCNFTGDFTLDFVCNNGILPEMILFLFLCNKK